MYEQTMQQFQGKMLPENNPLTKMCERVVARLGPVTGMEGVDWRVHVIDENVPNAFVIPGGQIFVFSVSPHGVHAHMRPPSVLSHIFSPSCDLLFSGDRADFRESCRSRGTRTV